MGRELKRVPLDFDAPLGKPWAKCPHCEDGWSDFAFSMVRSGHGVEHGVTAAVREVTQ